MEIFIGAGTVEIGWVLDVYIQVILSPSTHVGQQQPKDPPGSGRPHIWPLSAYFHPVGPSEMEPLDYFGWGARVDGHVLVQILLSLCCLYYKYLHLCSGRATDA